MTAADSAQPSTQAAARRRYDLLSAAADYPTWDGPPTRSLLVCAHPRSGSTLLCEAIHRAGGLGCPFEYFHRGFRPGLSARWRTHDVASYPRAVHRHRTDPSGVLSGKLFWMDVMDIVQEADPLLSSEIAELSVAETAPGVYHRVHSLLCDIFPDPTFIYVTRRDRVRQAVSTAIAAQTQLWRAIPGVGETDPLAPATYDYDSIRRSLTYADYCNVQWRRFFAENDLTPTIVVYESLVSDYAATVQRVLESLDRPHQAPAPRMRRQANALSEEFVLRFLRDHRDRVEATTT